MQKPKPGYYRKMLPSCMEGIRIALTSWPMTGVIKRADLVERLATHFEAVPDPYGCFYAEGLRSGAMIPVVPVDSQKVWQAGELFMKS